MVSPNRRKFARGRARKADRTRRREPAYVVVLICEGATEAHYLKALAHDLHTPAVTVEVRGQRGVPITVVTEACSVKDELARDARAQGNRGVLADHFEVWAVVDRDDHPRFHDAAKKAKDNGVGFAWSTPCVELWALLHLRDHTAHLHRHDCQKALREVMPGYDHERSPYFDLEQMTDARREAALLRAVKLHARAAVAGDAFYNPTTAMWKPAKVIEHGSSKAARAAAAVAAHPSKDWWLPHDPGNDAVIDD